MAKRLNSFLCCCELVTGCTIISIMNIILGFYGIAFIMGNRIDKDDKYWRKIEKKDSLNLSEDNIVCLEVLSKVSLVFDFFLVITSVALLIGATMEKQMLVNIFTLFAVLTVAFNFSALIAYKVLLGEYINEVMSIFLSKLLFMSYFVLVTYSYTKEKDEKIKEQVLPVTDVS